LSLQEHKTDQQLLDLFYKDRNNEWLGILLNRYTLLLLGTCMKYLKNEEDAKDAVQQIFMKVLGELSKYKVDYFKTWLYSVARNHCLMELRKKRHHAEPYSDRLAEQQVSDIQSLLEKEKTLLQVVQAIDQLNEGQRICISLFYLKKMSYDSISEKTGYSLLQVKSHIQNGKRNLKLIIENNQ
jgi:RNA polymerase sigma-70 factor (ECF subfamily)